MNKLLLAGWMCVVFSYLLSILLLGDQVYLVKKGGVSFGFEGLLFIIIEVILLAIFLMVKQSWTQIVAYIFSVILFIYVVVNY